MSKDQVKKIVKNYAEVLKKNGFVFSRIYLFGSHATGQADGDSDIDVAVVAKNVNENNYWDKKMFLWKLAPRADARIEPTLIAELDFKTGGTQMAYETKKRGERVV